MKPSPDRPMSWATFVRSHAHLIAAADFLTTEVWTVRGSRRDLFARVQVDRWGFRRRDSAYGLPGAEHERVCGTVCEVYQIRVS